LETNFQPIGTVSIPTRTDIDLDTVEDWSNMDLSHEFSGLDLNTRPTQTALVHGNHGDGIPVVDMRVLDNFKENRSFMCPSFIHWWRWQWSRHGALNHRETPTCPMPHVAMIDTCPPQCWNELEVAPCRQLGARSDRQGPLTLQTASWYRYVRPMVQTSTSHKPKQHISENCKR
jgi:hypothetical protein